MLNGRCWRRSAVVCSDRRSIPGVGYGPAQSNHEEIARRAGVAAGLGKRDAAWTGGPPFDQLTEKQLKKTGKDAAGKDSTIKHVMSGVNPQGVRVVSFKQPSSEELAHDFLWHIYRALPARGEIGIFNRSHYEEVVALRVHPEWLARQNLPPGPRDAQFWANRFDDINAFERHLDRNGTKIVKFFLHVSREEQRRRFLARIETAEKRWKFSASDLPERARWDECIQAYEEAITATSTTWAPWYVIPADHKPVMRAMVARILVDTIRSLDLSWPEISETDDVVLADAQRRLLAESA